MAIPYTQDWAAGNSTFTSMDNYDRTTNGPDALYPEVNKADGVTVVGGVLDWNTTYSDYQDLSLWLRGMGSLSGGGAGGYAGSGFWNGAVGHVECTYIPNATSLADISYAPLIWLISPSATSLLGLYWDSVSGDYEIERNTESGYALNAFSGPTPTDGVPLTIRIEWRCGTYPGVVPTDHDADGYLRVYINGVLEYDESNIALYLTFSSSPVDLVDGVAFGFLGFLGSIDDISISDAAPVLENITIFGSNTTTKASNVVAFGMDGATNVVEEEGRVQVYGNAAVSNGFIGPMPISAPTPPTGEAAIYIDSADGDLKIKFANGSVVTLANN